MSFVQNGIIFFSYLESKKREKVMGKKNSQENFGMIILAFFLVLFLLILSSIMTERN